MPKKIITIIGLGLMGGSLALALKTKSKSFRIFAVSRNPQKIRYALRKRIIDAGSERLHDIPRNTHLICVCTPVPQIVPTVHAVDRLVHSPVLVTDVGSTKSSVLNGIARARLKNVIFVGSHPMAGDHETGLNAARENLYQESLVFITPNGSSAAALKKVMSFWKAAGAKHVLAVSAREHDRIVSEVSHLPHLIASLLTLAVSPKHLSLAGPGFRDATRIAQGDPDLWLGILSTNPHLKSQMRSFEKQIRKLAGLIARKDWSRLRTLLAEAARRRRKL